MKSSIFRSLVCASILVFAIGCGKDNKSGGSGISGVNLGTQNLDASSQNAIVSLTEWYNSTNEGTAQSQGYYSPGPTVFKISKYKFNSSSSNSNCSTNQVSGGWLGNVLGAIGMNQYQVCSGVSNPTQQGTLVSTQDAVNLASTNGIAINAKGNAELNALVSGAKGTLINASAYGNIIRIVVLNGSTIQTYTVDKNYHSVFNPVIAVESVNGVITETRTFGQALY